MRVLLGNSSPRGLPEPAARITTAIIPDGLTPDEEFLAITGLDGVWANHSTAPAPDWVEADDPDFAARIAAHYGIAVGRPDDWEDDTP
jgi:hypothetical protein